MSNENWQPISTAPKDATEIRVRMADGAVHERAHWACDLSGEGQPPFRGWFIPVISDGRMREIAPPPAPNEKPPANIAHEIAQAVFTGTSSAEIDAFTVAFTQARRLVHEHRERLLRVATHLMTRRTMDETDLQLVLGPRIMMAFLHQVSGPLFISLTEPPQGRN